ncbi:DNA-binding response regulator, partial [bacterium]|nr:DNA-binding response regulator [bacterium]
EHLHISTRTVETHRTNIMQKLRLHKVADLVKYAIRRGLVQVEP